MWTGSGRLAARRVGPAVGSGLLLVAVSCGGEAGPDASSRSWGPLAVAEFDGGDEALVTGTIQITDNCVLLMEGDELVLLVWPRTRTGWDSQNESVEFATRSGARETFRNGDQVTLAGGGSSEAENPDTFLESVDWVSKPDRECVVEVRWFVSDTVNA